MTTKQWNQQDNLSETSLSRRSSILEFKNSITVLCKNLSKTSISHHGSLLQFKNSPPTKSSLCPSQKPTQSFSTISPASRQSSWGMSYNSYLRHSLETDATCVYLLQEALKIRTELSEARVVHIDFPAPGFGSTESTDTCTGRARKGIARHRPSIPQGGRWRGGTV